MVVHWNEMVALASDGDPTDDLSRENHLGSYGNTDGGILNTKELTESTYVRAIHKSQELFSPPICH